MNFLANENIDSRIVKALQAIGFDIESVLYLKPGATDREVLELALSERAVLISGDLGIASQVYFYQLLNKA